MPDTEAEDFGVPVNMFEGYSPEAAFEAGWDRAARRFEPHKARAEAAEARAAELEALLVRARGTVSNVAAEKSRRGQKAKVLNGDIRAALGNG